jgi:outer membrane protein OmpA-like peptidoglycan-associated protein
MAALAVAALIALALLTAKPVETFVVLPSADGHIGTVVVQRGAERQVLHAPYAASRVGESQVVQLSPADVERTYGATLHALPSRPASFLLYFTTGTDELIDESKPELERMLAAMRSRPLADVIVIGHTDTVGDMLANDELSAQRAERVKGFLIGIGIPGERIRTAGRGERELLVPTADEVDEAKNRRVEINVR